VSKNTVQIPVAIQGTVKKINKVNGRTGEYAVLDLVRPYRKTDRIDVMDAACFSIWSTDLNAFSSYHVGKAVLAFGIWGSSSIKESHNKKADAPIKLFRNHELRLWLVTLSQLCAIKH
jgi:hypothetical protein